MRPDLARLADDTYLDVAKMIRARRRRSIRPAHQWGFPIKLLATLLVPITVLMRDMGPRSPIG